ncbi:hypothetical protein [Vallitalea guaymasensis]|uniref:hypothetical protein n=1 Tax=Vallitalea guaymasensis TaxID=1185412 RepID=UPI0023522D02|nr:hypothetical protein [Vallitalea guaymasensis]
MYCLYGNNNNELSPVEVFKIFGYLSNTAGLEKDLLEMQKTLDLTSEEIEEMKDLVITREMMLNDESRSVLAKRAVREYNELVEDVSQRIVAEFKRIIGNEKYKKLNNYLKEWFGLETNYRKRWLREKNRDLMRGGIGTVYATQCYCESALPCLCLKFANIGKFEWLTPECKKIYKKSYPIDIYYKGNTVKDLIVKEAGPYNIKDDYWNCICRKYKDLDCMMPMAQAAFFDNYNDGKDEYGRIVLLQAGIDLNVKTAKKLGLNHLQNAWIEVDFSKLPMCPN